MKRIYNIFMIVLLSLSFYICVNINELDNITSDMETTLTSSNFTNTNTIYLTNNYSAYYFKNLTNNFGRNDKGSCTYVALAQMLSFWDTCWDDTLIPEYFDLITLLSTDSLSLSIESPGVRQESFNGRTMTAQQYYNQVETQWGSYFHLFLIKTGKELFGQYKFDNASSPCGLSYSQLLELTNYYLYTYRNYSHNDFEVLTTNTNVRSFIISRLLSGYPVEIRMGKSTGSGGHAMIAYDYDYATDEIYVHPGWKDYPTHVKLSELGYDQFWDATCIVPTKNHACSNNYLYSVAYTSHSHCSCELGKQPNKYLSAHSSHSYVDHYQYYSNTQHKAYCECGQYTLKNHEYNGVWVSGNQVKGTCTKCLTTCTIRTLSMLEVQLYNYNLLNIYDLIDEELVII